MSKTSGARRQIDQKGASSSGSTESPLSDTPYTLTESATGRCGSNPIESTTTESFTPASADSASATAASISLAETALRASGEERDMSSSDIRGISVVCLVNTFQRLWLVFPLNVEWRDETAAVQAAEVYANLLSDIAADECKAAIIRCAKTLTRFPFPADIRAAAAEASARDAAEASR